ncbi:MAG: hypothetical protein V9F04_13870 [Dermatophilaceae bacterium]
MVLGVLDPGDLLVRPGGRLHLGDRLGDRFRSRLDDRLGRGRHDRRGAELERRHLVRRGVRQRDRGRGLLDHGRGLLDHGVRHLRGGLGHDG